MQHHNLPAHATKGVELLSYTLPDRDRTRVLLHQDNHSPDSTGRTVWLGAQVLSVYLQDLLGSEVATARRKLGPDAAPPRAIDLGSGTGLVALMLANLGYDTLATDVEMIVQGVLARNVTENAPQLSRPGRQGNRIRQATLDWFTFDCETWTWPEDDDDNDKIVAESTSAASSCRRGVDLITTADTVYDLGLSEPLLRTLHGLVLASSSSSSSSPPPPIYLALEARDPALIASFFALASSAAFRFKCSRVDPARIRKLVEAREGTLGWQDEADWEGVEVWKLALSKQELSRARTAARQQRRQQEDMSAPAE
ncbi:hypothetical protein JCM3774_006400 [Rhodotorula dairenensis]